jgi:arginyl-tRNA synthetase
VVLRADGTAVYITQDISTTIRKFEDYRMDRSLYVVAAEQDVHFRNLFAILRLLGHDLAGRCAHVSYAMVNLARGMGKLKSREGKKVDADNLLDDLHRMAKAKIIEAGHTETLEAIDTTAEQIGQGALKLYLLQVSPEKTIVFDPEQTIAFAGDTGPAVQYSHARIHGIVRKGLAAGKLTAEDLETDPGASVSPAGGGGASEAGAIGAGAIGAGASGGAARTGSAAARFLRANRVDAGLLTEPEEREVLRLLAEFPDTVMAAARQLSPAPVANALLDLTKAYARMYHQHEVLKADAPLMRARVQLALCTAQVLQNGLRLLTIEAPERM